MFRFVHGCSLVVEQFPQQEDQEFLQPSEPLTEFLLRRSREVFGKSYVPEVCHAFAPPPTYRTDSAVYQLSECADDENGQTIEKERERAGWSSKSLRPLGFMVSWHRWGTHRFEPRRLALNGLPAEHPPADQ